MQTRMVRNYNLGVRMGLVACVLLTLAWAGYAQDVAPLMQGITSASADARAAAWKTAGPLGAAAVAPLGQRLADPDAGIAKAARAALTNIVTYAGRPGAAPNEAPGVAAELVKLLDKSVPDVARREVLNDLSMIAGDAEAPAIAALLADPGIGEDARLALERIPGDASVHALIAALDTAPDNLRGRIAASLAQKNAGAAIPKLQALARANVKSELLWPCVEALARLGVPPNQVVPRLPGFTPEQAERYLNGFITAAGALAAQGKRDQSERLYTSVAAFYDRPHQASAALVGLMNLGSDKLLRHAIGNLDTPALRAVAIDTLIQVKLAEVDDAVAKAYDVSNPGKRTGILLVLAGRKSPQLPRVLSSALNDPSPEVRIAAAPLAGQQPAEADVFEVAAKGYPWSWEPALKACLDLGTAKLQGGDREAARAVFERVVTGEFPARYKVGALSGLGETGSQASRALLKGLLNDAELGAAAGRAYAAVLAAQDDKENAKKELFAFAEETSAGEVASAAMAHLRNLGVDTLALPARKGFIARWRIIGPFPNSNGSAFGKSFLPEAEADGQKGVDFEGVSYAWKDAVADHLPADIDLRPRFETRNNVAAYAYAEVTVATETPVLFLLGSNDGCEFWVNGEKRHEFKGGRGMVVDGDRVEAALKPGVNKVLIKVLQEGGAWQFCVRVADRQGAPLDLSR